MENRTHAEGNWIDLVNNICTKILLRWACFLYLNAKYTKGNTGTFYCRNCFFFLFRFYINNKTLKLFQTYFCRSWFKITRTTRTGAHILFLAVRGVCCVKSCTWRKNRQQLTTWKKKLKNIITIQTKGACVVFFVTVRYSKRNWNALYTI